MKKIWKQFDKTLIGGITVLVLAIMGYVWWLYEPTNTVPMWAFFLAILISYVIILSVYAVTSVSHDSEIVYTLPRAIAIEQRDDSVIFLLEPSDLYTYGIFVSVFHKSPDREIERALGVGIVDTINDGRPQIVLMKDKCKEPDVVETLDNKSDTLRCIKIRPSVRREDL